MARIEINGIPVEARDGAMVIEAADEAGIVIPRFCYHKKLSIAANCRMCLVEVEKVAKPLPACATPVSDGMKVFTRSPKAIAAQRAVMEFLLINHPLDCPICDQGGECDLQEMALGFGQDVSRYAEGKRVVADKDIGPLIATDMTRCIHCTRCVRFGQEIAGTYELGATGRGEHTLIGTYVEKAVASELSGNVIDLCPVGALTSKPYRYRARPWELIAHESVSPHDCVGANLRVDVRRGKVMRVLPRENEAVNETWIADRDRFSYLGLESDRLLTPRIKRDGQWQESDWDTALTYVAERLKAIVTKSGGDRIGALAGYTATLEECYLLQRVMRGIGSGNIDHRLRQQDFRADAQAPLFPWLGQTLQELEQLDAALLIGSNVRKEQPLVGLRLRKAALKGARIAAINPFDYPFNFPLSARLVSTPAGMVRAAAGIAKALLALSGETAPPALAPVLAGIEPNEAQRRIARELHEAETGAVLLGNVAAHHPAFSALQALAALIARLAGARVGLLAEGGNAAGAWLAGALPHREAGGEKAVIAGRNWREMVDAGLEAYLLLGTEPEVDCLEPAAVSAALGKGFVVALNGFVSEAMREYADVLLPIALFPETSGTFVNGEGRWQSFSGCVAAPGDARPAWKVLRVLGNLFDLEHFEYLSSEEVREEVRTKVGDRRAEWDLAWQVDWSLPEEARGLVRVGDYPIYASDGLVRRSAALQNTPDAQPVTVRINAATATKLQLGAGGAVRVRQGEGQVVLPLLVDEGVADDCAYLPAGNTAVAALGGLFDGISLEAAEQTAETDVRDRKRG